MADENYEKAIFCLEHCKGQKIFSFRIPPCCTYCGTGLNDCILRIPPFRLPSPFRDAKMCPCSIVLKPTKGDFLTDYKNSDNLHIGVTNSSGVVYEYDMNGLTFHKTSNWKRCLAIKDFNKDKDFGSWSQYWDFTLDVVSGHQEQWARTRYDEDRHNCYSFVLAFLKALQVQELSSFARDRRMFCEKYILPKTASAAKYITLYRKLMSEPHLVLTNKK